MKISGDRELARALDVLGDKANQIVKPAVNAGLTPINKAAKRNVPTDMGLLKRSIGKLVKVYKRSGVIYGAVGARTSPQFSAPDAAQGRVRIPKNYAHLVELGTIDQPARPFLRPALDANRTTAFGIVKTKTIQGIERRAAREGRKR